MFNLAIDSKLRGCDVVAVRVEDVAPNGYTVERATVRQRKTGRPVKFELTEQSRQAIEDYLRSSGKKPGEFLFTSRRQRDRCMTTRQYARLVSEWIGSIGLDPRLFGTHSLRRTKATLIYRRTGNLRASSFCSKQRHTAHEHPVEGRIYYRFHPRCGETVLIRRQLEYRGVELAVILQPDSSLASIPAWMTHEAAAQYALSEKPRFSVDILRSLRIEIDALLGFLQSESTTEEADNDAPIQKPPTEPVRRRGAPRRVGGRTDGRSGSSSESPAVRDRDSASKRGDRG